MTETHATEPEQSTADCGRPCNARFPESECPNMKPVPGDLDLEIEHYSCAVCGRTVKLWYDEMR